MTSSNVPVESREQAPSQCSSHTADGARIRELDVARGIAILLVLLNHAPGVRGQSGVLRPLDGLIHHFGWVGVDLFFVLSGFLVGGLLFGEIQRSGTIDIRRFVLRRMLRLWPAYYLFLVFATWRTANEDPSHDLRAAFSLFTPAYLHMQNFFEVPRGQLWSLAVEEHFYLILPLLLAAAVATRRDRTAVRAVPWICLALCIGSAMWRGIITDVRSLRLHTFSTIDGLFSGVLLAYLRAYRPAVFATLTRRPVLMVTLGIVLLAPGAVPYNDLVRRHSFTTVYLGQVCLLLALLAPREASPWLYACKQGWFARGLAWVGTYSYSIYLWHKDTSLGLFDATRQLGDALHLPTELTWTLQIGMHLCSTVLCGAALGRIIEQPMLQLRERLVPRQTTGASASSAAAQGQGSS